MRWNLVAEAKSENAFPVRRMGGVTWNANGRLWLFSGVGSIEESASLTDMWSYHLDANIWKRISMRADESEIVPSGRETPATWAEQDALCMYGGAIKNIASSEFLQFDTRMEEWIAKAPSDPGATPGVRSGSVAWQDETGRAWLFGGIGKAADGNLNVLGDLWSYSSDRKTWQREQVNQSNGKLPQPRTHMSSCQSTKSCWIFGGLIRSESGRALSDLWSLDKDSGVAQQWWDGTNSTSGPGIRTGATLFCDRSENIYVFGGMDANTRDLHNDIWRFETSSREWERLSCSGPSPRTQASAWIDAGHRLWLFGGYGVNARDEVGLLADFWSLTSI